VDKQLIPDSNKDYLWLNLKELPYFRALLRAVEARYYKTIDLPSPTLDLGCGDGQFASVAFERKLDVGVDPWWGPLKEAKGRDSYQDVALSNGAFLPFPNKHFASAVSNSVLEHILPVDAVLHEISRVLKPGSPFVFCVPNHRFLNTLFVGKMLNKIGLKPIGNAYRSFFNRISRHYHCDPQEIWEERLTKAGFHINSWWDYFSPAALTTLELGHYLGLPSLVSRLIFHRWIIAPTHANLFLTDRLIRKHYEGISENEKGVYTFYIAEKD